MPTVQESNPILVVRRDRFATLEGAYNEVRRLFDVVSGIRLELAAAVNTSFIDVSAIEADITAIQADIVTIQADITTLQAAVAALQVPKDWDEL